MKILVLSCLVMLGVAGGCTQHFSFIESGFNSGITIPVFKMKF